MGALELYLALLVIHRCCSRAPAAAFREPAACCCCCCCCCCRTSGRTNGSNLRPDVRPPSFPLFHGILPNAFKLQKSASFLFCSLQTCSCTLHRCSARRPPPLFLLPFPPLNIKKCIQILIHRQNKRQFHQLNNTHLAKILHVEYHMGFFQMVVVVVEGRWEKGSNVEELHFRQF